MKLYTCDVFNDNGFQRVWMESWEFRRVRFTARELKELVLVTLFSYAAETIENKYLTATICCDGVPVLSVRSTVTVDGSYIYCDIYLAKAGDKYNHYRRMTIAD